MGTNAAGEPHADKALGEVFRYLKTRVHSGDADRLKLAAQAPSRPVPPAPNVPVDCPSPVQATVGFNTFQVGKAGDRKPLVLDSNVYADSVVRKN